MSANKIVHPTPKARAFFTLAILEQNFAFAKSSLAFGAGDSHVMPFEITFYLPIESNFLVIASSP